MKIKKISAIILAGALLASAVGMNAFAADANAKPTITVFGNESSPAKPDSTVELNVRLSNFNTIKGMDLELTLDNADKVKLTNATGKIGGNDLVKGTNYTVSDGKIHIVELNADNETINFKVTASVDKAATAGEYKVNVSKSDLALDGSSLATDKDSVGGNIVVGTTSATVKDSTTELVAEDGCFIPFGSVYDANNTFVKKDGNGKFTVSAGTTYQQFAIPYDITTFGVSDKFTASNNKNNLQFGTYANNYNNSNYGTMLILGDFNTAANYVREKSGCSVKKLLSTVSNAFDENNIKTDGSEYLPVVCKDSNGNKVELKVIKVLQTKYLWKNTDESACEYALRVINVKDSETYTAVGYHGSVLSTEIKTEKYTTKE